MSTEDETIKNAVAKERELVEAQLSHRKVNRPLHIDPSSVRLTHPKLKELKSDLKKATIWGKKFRTYTADQEAPILKDLSVFNVKMFVKEAAQGVGPCIFDSKLKLSEVPGLVTCCGAVHQKYDEFLAEAMQGFQKAFSLQPVLDEVHKKVDPKEPPADITRLRVAMRFMCEMFLTGLAPKGLFFVRVCHQFLSAIEGKAQGPENVPPHITLNILSLVNMIVKTIGIEFLGPKPIELTGDKAGTTVQMVGHKAQKRNMTEKDDSPVLVDELALEVAQANCDARLTDSETIANAYSSEQERIDLAKRLVGLLDHGVEMCKKYKKGVEAKWKHMCEATEIRGDVTDEVKETLNALKKIADRTYVQVETLAQMLSLEARLPEPIDLSKALASSNADQNIVFGSKLADFYTVKEPENWRYFDDEDIPFYEELLPIDGLLPDEVVTKGLTFTVGDAGKKAGAEEEATMADEYVSRAAEFTKRDGVDYSQCEELLQSMHQCAAKEYCDKWLTEFFTEATKRYHEATTGNTNPTQAPNYLMNCLRLLFFELRFAPTNANEMLPMLARVAATVAAHFTELGEQLSSKLEGELFHCITKKTADSYMRKMRSARYLSELCKFRVAPPIRVFRVMQLCLDDLENQNNQEILISLLEHCGPFLIRGGMTKIKLEEMLKRVNDLRYKVSISSDRDMALDNSLSIIKQALKPKGKRVVLCKVITPLEMYVRTLLFSRLTDDAFFTVRSKMRMMPWNDANRASLVVRTMRKVHKCSWDRIHLLAEIIADVTDVHGWVAVDIVDNVLEDLRQDLEIPGSRRQQKRLQDLKFLGELYNFRLVTMKVITYVFLQLLLYKPCPMLPGDYSRVRSVLTLLQTSVPYFLPKCTNATRQLMRVITAFFFSHVHSRTKPLPLDLDFQLAETIQLVASHTNLKHISPKEHINFPRTASEAKVAEEQILAEKMELPWLLKMVTSMRSSAEARIFPILESVAPVEMDQGDKGDDGEEAGNGGPRSKPLEAAESECDDDDSMMSASSSSDDDDGDSSSSSSDSDSSMSDEEDSLSGSSVSDDDEDDISSSDDDSISSDDEESEEDEESDDEETESDEEEEEFQMPALGPGAAFGQAGATTSSQSGAQSSVLTEEDKEFDELFREMYKESTSEAVKRGHTKNITKAVEDRMSRSVAPLVKKATEAPNALAVATAFAPAKAPPQKIAFLRRNKEKVEARNIYVPSSSAFAQHAASAQQQYQQELEEVRRQTMKLNRQQEEESDKTYNPNWRGPAARGRGRM